MISHKFTYNGLTINDMTDIIKFKNGVNDWAITLSQVTGFSSPEIRDADRPFSGNHGIVDYQTFIGKRSITFQGYIVAKSEAKLREAVQALQVAFSLPAFYSGVDTGYHELFFETQDGDDKFKCNAKIATLPRIDKTFKAKNYRQFFIALKCADPRLYSQDIIEVPIKRTWFQSGILLPTYLPTTLGSQSVYRKNLINLGNFATAPLIKIEGYTKNPILINQTHNIKMQFNCELQEGEYLIVDVFNHTIYDQDGVNRINYLSEDSQWLWLLPLDNYIDYFDDQDSPIDSGIIPTDKVTITYSYASI